MLGSPGGGQAGGHKILWPPSTVHPQPAHQQPAHDGGYGRYGVYSLFPGAGSPAPGGQALYQQHCAPASVQGRLGPQTTAFHQPQQSPHKVAESLFSPGSYAFAPTPPPGSPYSPSLNIPTLPTLTPTTDLLLKPIPSVTATQFELVAKKETSPASITSTDGDASVGGKWNNNSAYSEDKCCVKSRCSCPNKMKYAEKKGLNGCSRTNPVKWSSNSVAVKREPAVTPCQVAEVTTSEVDRSSIGGAVVKLEAADTTSCTTTTTHQTTTHQKTEIHLSQTLTNGNIPVGIAVARQRLQQDVSGSPNLATPGEIHSFPGAPTLSASFTTASSHQLLKEVSRITDVDVSAGMAAAAAAGGAMGGTLLQCTDDRLAGLAAWPVGGSHTHASSLATPTLWQYPGYQHEPKFSNSNSPFLLYTEPVMPFPVPMPPVGFQLVRDPSSGHFLLIPTASIEQAMVWPTYPQPPSHVLLPPMPPPPLAPLQLLSSPAQPTDYLATSTTLHQHTTQHSTRLVALTTATTDHKRKVPIPISGHTLIKIEADCTSATTLDHTKSIQQTVSTVSSNSGAIFTESPVTPLLTTHVFYQHPTTNLILSSASTQQPQQQQAIELTCKSQATSPVSCLTPPPESTPVVDDENSQKDASNQTETISEDEKLPTSEDEDKTTLKPILDIKKTSELIEINNTQVPEVSNNVSEVENVIENENDTKPKPDISGLELLSNSIVEYENCRNKNEVKFEETTKNDEDDPENGDEVLKGIADMTIKDKETEVYSKSIDDNLGGLNLLCALAEQRFVEEVLEKQNENKTETDFKHYKQYKKPKNLTNDDKNKDNNIFKCTKVDLKVKKPEYNTGNDSVDDELDLEREKANVLKKVAIERELNFDFCAISKKTERKKDDEGVKNCNCDENKNKEREWSPSFITEVERNFQKLADIRRKYSEQIKKSETLTKSNPSPTLLEKLDNPIRYRTPPDQLIRPSTLSALTTDDGIKTPIKTIGSILPSVETAPKRKSSCTESDSTPEKISSSKKRKVGRPKKLLSAPGIRIATETIVAKKPKSKNSLVGFLLAAKNRLNLQKSNGIVMDSPPKFVEEKKHKIKTHKIKSISKSKKDEVKKKKHKISKIRPKLKAEPKMKTEIQEEEECSEWEVTMPVEEDIEPPIEEDPIVEETPVVPEVPEQNIRCVLTVDMLDKDKLRVLTAMGGLFYAGQLTAIQPPDIYAITLDGERGNRPHIMSREEILQNAIVEVSPANVSELYPGTRMCAYWSQQYRCLYPGTVAEPGTPDPVLDGKFVCVEFDDGDSGRIAIEDIRLLPQDYPIIEYDPNPLLSLSKRRRRTSVNSTTEPERRLSQPTMSTSLATIPESPKVDNSIAEKENTDTNKQDMFATDAYHERKKLKKKRKDKFKKLMFKTDKEKKHKHRCCDEHCKHRKHHKKHRKHKKHHHRSGTDSSSTITVEEPQVEDQESLEVEPVKEVEELEEVNGNIIEETNIVHKEIMKTKTKKAKKGRERQESVESRSKMAAFLPARQLWNWSGKGYKRVGIRGRARKQFFREIQRGKEFIKVGDCAVFLSTGRPDRPYIGKIEAMWESWGTNMVVKVKWFYHPEETVGRPLNLQYPGALFESPHTDENDVQTISHKCEVLPLKEYTKKLGSDSRCYETIYENNDLYYLAGYYDPTTTTLTMEPDIPVTD